MFLQPGASNILERNFGTPKNIQSGHTKRASAPSRTCVPNLEVLPQKAQKAKDQCTNTWEERQGRAVGDMEQTKMRKKTNKQGSR